MFYTIPRDKGAVLHGRHCPQKLRNLEGSGIILKKKTVSCKACGAEISQGLKTCPHCGEKVKKPLFKKWWFWVLVLLLVAGAAGGGSDEAAPSAAPTQPQQIAQSPETAPLPKPTTSPETAPAEETTAPLPTETEIAMTVGQKNALRSAKTYLAFTAFSYEGLIHQLEFEQYPHEDAVFAADNCGANWEEQALKSALNYLDFSAFSYKGLIKQLEFEKYTTEQATYAADNCGADWNEQAAKSAENYLSVSSFSRNGLIQQLKFEGFTAEQAQYGVEANGL